MFIAYADLPAARRAIAVINEVLRATRRRFAFRPMLWRFDQLAAEKWRACALTDAAATPLVIFASTGAGELSPALESWTNALLTRKRGERLTLVALLGADDTWTISIEGLATAAPALAEMETISHAAAD
ncbi:MAG TPA: hypothetical protein VHD62_09005 [Opitutaceae bacterium]|nr:hypothetical protein [Opitutaceae bacterium]